MSLEFSNLIWLKTQILSFYKANPTLNIGSPTAQPPNSRICYKGAVIPANWAKTSREHMNFQNVPIIKYNVKAFILTSITNFFFIEVSIFMDIIAKEVRHFRNIKTSTKEMIKNAQSQTRHVWNKRNKTLTQPSQIQR